MIDTSILQFGEKLILVVTDIIEKLDQNNEAVEECSMIYSLHNPVSQLLRSTEPPTPSHDSCLHHRFCLLFVYTCCLEFYWGKNFNSNSWFFCPIITLQYPRAKSIHLMMFRWSCAVNCNRAGLGVTDALLVMRILQLRYAQVNHARTFLSLLNPEAVHVHPVSGTFPNLSS